MLRVMLIDDEPLALEGLKLLIDWPAEGFQICGECASARDALAMLPKAKPDLIVTDIRMPGMSGLELLGEARRAGFDGQFVIVSGYGDFQYAKQALQLGVAGYLLKPVEPADASAVLAHVRRKLIDRETEGGRRAMAVHYAIGALLAQVDAPGGDLPAAARWVLATWGAPLSYPVVQSILALFPGGEATAHIVEDKEYLVLRMQSGEQQPDLNKVVSLLEKHGLALHVSEPAASPAMLYALRQQLSDQLESACRKALPEHVDRLVHVIALRQADECKLRCAELEAVCAACGSHAATYAKRQLLSACSGLLGGRPEALKTFLASQDAGLETLCLLAVELLAPEQESVSDRMAQYALEHIAERVTLSELAEALTYNATYLGRKFSEERGVSFRDWLTQARMEVSAKLLRGTNQSVNDISKAVGYDYYKRFLKHFKKSFGVAPEQYRRKKP